MNIRPLLEPQNLSKSLNEALILSLLAGGPRHGYQLALEIEERSEGFFRFNHGTLYPILHKLEKDGLIEGRWSGEDRGRKRKSYVLTRKGASYERRLRGEWNGFMDRLLAVIGGEDA